MKIKDYHYYKDLQIKSDYKWCTNNNHILMIKNIYKKRIIYDMANASNYSNWLIDNKKILLLKYIPAFKAISIVIHYLARWHPYWVTKNIEILNLKAYKGNIKDILIQEGKL